MNKHISNIILAGALALTTFSCNKDLNRVPINTTTAQDVFSTAASTKEALAKVYGAFALTGSTGSGSSDLGGIDAGTSDFLRLYWNAQELPTDESICAWGDPGISDLNFMSWTSGNILLNGLYNRSLYQITVVNSFLRSTEKPASGISATDLTHYRAEARFLRAYQYWVLMDLFGNPPFIDENSLIGTVPPKQIMRADLFKYVESELLAIIPDLAAPKTNEYGRADQAADWALLARLYLNAKVYTGTDRSTDAITYATKVINAGYSLMPKYKNLFMADDNKNNPETILSINYDLNQTQNYGGTTFLVNGCIDGNIPGGPSAYGVPGGGWGGNRARSPLPKLFGSDYTTSNDSRAKLLQGNVYDISSVSTFAQGIKTAKFSNMNSDGTTPANASVYVSTDFPLFRLGEQYLIYAEAVLRGGTGGDMATAISYINKLRERAYGNTSGDVTSISLPFILDERARELYIEGFRRTDLIRFGEFTTSTYIWPWKGGTAGGRSVEDKYNLYPIPSSDIVSNTNLVQNPGYGGTTK
ncbi:RagB/SusD family nutrient uptake outer membrane protein [Arachidicoccus soli]|uniref:RagB/SusD family nutrient uptake outer membrane protein n=1 Tax=Arachidicoccus soli TaxID=2341117 RepID=A0A386HSP9_9BACT|nr:RagB/SusD family nutrient uptake outer membrane protein [Arachidicoccus soli]AYD48833.1 RagB/SusD family nutrient uptake outer membrane protein [Arachidicoccus soli]